MGFGSTRRSRHRAVLLAGVVVIGGLLPASALASVRAAPAADRPAGERSAIASGAEPNAGTDRANGEEKPGYYDSRTEPAARAVLQRRAATAAAKPGVRQLRRSLGTEGIVDVDPVTATPRQVARTDGFLTGPSDASPQTVALAYVREHADVFRLSADDIANLTLRKDYVDVDGTHHLSYIQSVDGIPVFGNGLKAHVAENGRLVAVDGSPVADLPASVPEPTLSATKARAAAVTDLFHTPKSATARTSSGATKETTFSNGDRARLVVFAGLGGPRTAWQTVTSPSRSQMFLHVVDAESGRVLFRQDLVHKDNASVFENYPGAPRGGRARLVDLPSRWLPPNSPRLAGNVAHVYSDVNDDDTAGEAEEIGPSGRRSFVYKQQTFDLGGDCSRAFPCTWDPATPNSWETNREQSGVQLFYFLGRFHDHLADRPIGFGREAGNFEAVDDDAVQGQSIDGADTADGLPDPNHIDNANMATPPDGIPPRMQMYLWHAPGEDDPFLPSNGSDAGDIVYHEYTHGLSNRLVVDANGVSTLGNIQAGSMGEAWSDWYALDFLASEGYLRDTRADGEMRIGDYVGVGADLIRFEPLDCAVGSTSAKCPGAEGAGSGGFTYGDFGKIAGAPEVHSDGEIWAQTLWDLRSVLGSRLSESLVTRAMELSPANPSFLDMRNSILQADLVVNHGKAHTKIWKVMAKRGMGFFAGSVDGDDTEPAEDFSLPPAPGTPTGTLTGTVTNSDSGAPVSGATVAFGGHNSGFAGDYAAVTGDDGTYSIAGIFPGAYPKVFAAGPGYDRQVETVEISSGDNTFDWSVRRNWASSSGGGTIADFNGPDFTDFGCGPVALIDQSQGAGWGSDVVGGTNGEGIDPRFAVVELPVPVDISELAIDPSATCGDAGSASAGDFTVETSPDGTTWTEAATGHFSVEHRNQMNVVPLEDGSGTGVKFIRYTILGSQVLDSDPNGTCPGAFSGCDFVDSVELAVYGAGGTG